MEAEVLFLSLPFLQAGKHHGEAARDCLSGEGCAELNHVRVLLAKQHIVSLYLLVFWAPSLAGALMVLKEFFEQYNQGYQHVKEHQHGTLTFIHAKKQVTIKITPWPCQCPKADNTGVQIMEEENTAVLNSLLTFL